MKTPTPTWAVASTALESRQHSLARILIHRKQFSYPLGFAYDLTVAKIEQLVCDL